MYFDYFKTKTFKKFTAFGRDRQNGNTDLLGNMILYHWVLDYNAIDFTLKIQKQQI